MQKSTDTLLDEKVTGNVDKTFLRTVKLILSSELKANAFKKNKNQKVTKNSSSASTQ